MPQYRDRELMEHSGVPNRMMCQECGIPTSGETCHDCGGETDEVL